MPNKSSNSAESVFADKKKVLRQLKEYAKKLKRSSPEIEKIGLFGSYASDTYGPASDVDLLLIVERSPKRFMDRIPDYFPSNLSVSCDVFPYTKEEVGRMKKENDPWIRHVLREVVWL